MSAVSDLYDKVKGKLEGLCEQFITDGLQEWSAASNAAIVAVPLPREEDSILYWVVSLAGNMLWAGTVFMRPMANGLPSPAQKTLSMIGAGFGSDTVRQVKNLVSSAPSPEHAKDFFGEISALRADQLEKQLVSNAADWVRDDLIEWVYRYEKEAWWKRNTGAKITPQIEQQRDQWIYQQVANLSAKDQNAYRHYTYNEYVFPGFFYNEKLEGTSIRRELLVKMKKAVSDSFSEYKNQYDQWQWRVNRQLHADMGHRPAPGTPGPPPVELRVPFEPKVSFAGQQLGFGPAGTKTPGQLVRIWKYGRDRA
jgi:hypothetical protein